MKLILTLLLFLSLSQADSKKWYGIFTTDTIPIDGCKIVEATSIYEDTISGRVFPKRKKLVGSSMEQQVKELNSLMIKTLQKKGFNAVVGYREISNLGFNGYDGKIINGDWGYAEFRVKIIAVPVKVECSTGLF